MLYYKILMNHLHLLILVSSFDFNWPRQIESFLADPHRAHAPSQELFSLECMVEDFTCLQFPVYLLNLAAYSTAPLVAALALFIFWRVKECRRRSGTARRACRKFVNSFYVLLFTLHPFIARSVFSVFK